MEELRSCYSFKLKCGYVTSADVPKCLRCGGQTKTAKQIRRLGWALVVFGLFLASVTGIISVIMAPFLMHLGSAENGGESTATAGQAMFLFGLIGVLILLGL